MGEPISSSSLRLQPDVSISQPQDKGTTSAHIHRQSIPPLSEEQQRKQTKILLSEHRMVAGVENNLQKTETTKLKTQRHQVKQIKEESPRLKELRALKITAQQMAYEIGSSLVKPFSASRAKWLDIKAKHKGYEIRKMFSNVTFQGKIKTFCRNIGKKHDLKEHKDLRVGQMLLEKAKTEIPGFINSNKDLPHSLLKGCCFGATLDALTRFSALDELTPENFEKLTSQYEEGVTPHAAANQALSEHIEVDFTIHGESDRERSDALFKNIFTPYMRKGFMPIILKNQETVSPGQTAEQANQGVSLTRWIMYRNLEVRQFLEHLPKDPQSGISENDALALRMILSKENKIYSIIDSGQEPSFKHALLDKYKNLEQQGVKQEDILKQLSEAINSDSQLPQEEKVNLTKLVAWLTDMKNYLAFFTSLSEKTEKNASSLQNVKSEDLRYSLEQHLVDSNIKTIYKALYKLRSHDIQEIPNFPSPLVNHRDGDKRVFEALETLPKGEYYINFATGSGRHAIGYIKYADGSGHIFDPNWGTIMITKEKGDHITQFKNLMNHYPNPNVQKNPRGVTDVPDHRISVMRVERHA